MSLQQAWIHSGRKNTCSLRDQQAFAVGCFKQTMQKEPSIGVRPGCCNAVGVPVQTWHKSKMPADLPWLHWAAAVPNDQSRPLASSRPDGRCCQCTCDRSGTAGAASAATGPASCPAMSFMTRSASPWASPSCGHHSLGSAVR